MRFLLIVAVLPALFVCTVAMAKVGTAAPTSTIGETSPLGIATRSAPDRNPVGRHRTRITRSQSGASGVMGTITIPSTSGGTACSTNWLWPGQLVKARIGQAARWQGCRAAFPAPVLFKGA
jgi:hypothetical protein